MRKSKLLPLLLLLACGARADDRDDVIRTREMVWRAWFANNVKLLQQLVPPETIVISPGQKEWKNQAQVFAEAADFQRDGSKLIKLEFPHTDIQQFGDVAIVYSAYSLDLQVDGKPVHQAGRATEVFVKRNGHWVNPGWHTDREQ